MLDRLDDALEPLARAIGGKSQWDEMKENAISASQPGGGLALVADLLADLTRRFPALQRSSRCVTARDRSLSAASSSGSRPAGGQKPVDIETCTLWAPACTMDVYRNQYLPSIKSAHIKNFALFTLTDKAERDDTCANIYHKSLLYLVSNAFEAGLQKAPFLQGARGRADSRHGEVRVTPAGGAAHLGLGAVAQRQRDGLARRVHGEVAWRLRRRHCDARLDARPHRRARDRSRTRGSRITGRRPLIARFGRR